VRAWSESGRAALCAGTAALVALVALGAGLMWMRAQRPH